jgi:glycosyltransferase involved in cell wall biosynthesis
VSEPRVLMIAPSAVPGGMEEVFFRLVALAADGGYRADPVLLQRGALEERLRAAGIAVEVYEAGRLRQPRHVLATARAIHRAIGRHAPDVVYANMPKAHCYAALPAALARRPALWAQGGIPEPPHWLDRAASLLPGAGVMVASAAAGQAQERLRGSPPTALVAPGIEVERYRAASGADVRAEHGIAPDALLVTLVGRLQPWKGQRELLAAARRVLDVRADVRFAIVGGAVLGWEGDYPETLRAQARELGIEHAVTFSGHTDRVPEWLAATDVAVNASDPEPFGLVVVEAMAAGCAVVAVDRGGPREIVSSGRDGLLVARAAADDLATAILELAADAGLRARLAAEARRTVDQRYTVGAMVRRFGELVRAVAAGRLR